MIEPFNKLSPAGAERLALLLEEMGEAQQAIGKILRHGYESRNPEGRFGHVGPSNRQALENELGDVLHAIDRLCESSDVNKNNIDRATARKAVSVGQWLHHQAAIQEQTK